VRINAIQVLAASVTLISIGTLAWGLAVGGNIAAIVLGMLLAATSMAMFQRAGDEFRRGESETRRKAGEKSAGTSQDP
jgi:Kef-type K+ transport system membrane component KefB